MAKGIRVLIVLALYAIFAAAQPTAAQEDQSMPRIIGYYTSWSIYDRHYYVTDIPADRLTHINYAFANISSSGECTLGDPWADTQFPYPGDTADSDLQGNFRQLQLLKEAHPHLKTLISVGGWTWSDKFSDVALTEESRRTFAASCVAFMKQYGFDGIDIDWEYPVGGGMNPNAGRPEDTENFTLLLAELRSQLDAQGEQDGTHYLLTIAAPASPGNYANMQLGEIHTYLDWINVMGYDFHGGWSSRTNFHAPLFASSADPAESDEERLLFNGDAALRAYLDAGVPADKLVLGVPFYGRGWAGVPNENNGLYQPFRGLPPGTWEQGAFDYSDLVTNYLPTYSRFWHDEAQAPWLYNPETQIMITYDDPDSLRIKARYVQEHGLGGIMFWELSADTDDSALLEAIYTTLNAGG